MPHVRTAMVFLEVTAHSPLQVNRLAHLKQLVIRIEIPIYPRQSRKRGDFL
jgi:hypothetical protein